MRRSVSLEPSDKTPMRTTKRFLSERTLSCSLIRLLKKRLSVLLLLNLKYNNCCSPLNSLT